MRGEGEEGGEEGGEGRGEGRRGRREGEREQCMMTGGRSVSKGEV